MELICTGIRIIVGEDDVNFSSPPPLFRPSDKWRSICPNDGAGGEENEFKLSFSGSNKQQYPNSDMCVPTSLWPSIEQSYLYWSIEKTVFALIHYDKYLPISFLSSFTTKHNLEIPKLYAKKRLTIYYRNQNSH